MKLDRTFSREIQAVNGDGGRDARFQYLKKLEAARRDLSTPGVVSIFADCVKRHGRATVAICIAVTIRERAERIDGWGMPWAQEVLKLWTNCTPANYHRALIDDHLHPTRICEYAAAFLRLTSVE